MDAQPASSQGDTLFFPGDTLFFQSAKRLTFLLQKCNDSANWQTSVVEELVRRGADVNIVNNEGFTALQVTVRLLQRNHRKKTLRRAKHLYLKVDGPLDMP